MEILIPFNIFARGGDGFDSEKEEVKAQILSNAFTRGWRVLTPRQDKLKLRSYSINGQRGWPF